MAQQSIDDTAAPGVASSTGWSPTPAIRVSIWLHIGTVLVMAVFPAVWPWGIAVLIGNHLVLGAVGMWPKSRLLGPNLVCLPDSSARRGEVALTFDDGPDPRTTPQILDLLDRYGATASFFCIGQTAAAHPDIVRDIIRRGHSVENHSCRHSNVFACYGIGALRLEIEAAQRIITGIAGRSPRYFRAPLGLRNWLLDPVLARMGLRYASWTRRGYDSVSRDPVGVLRRLTRGLAAGDVLMLHDGRSARTMTGEPVVLVVLPLLLEQLAAQGLKPISLPAALANESAPLEPSTFPLARTS